MISISYGQMLNIHTLQWSQIFAQARFTFVVNNILHKGQPFSILLKQIEADKFEWFLIAVPLLLFKGENILQIPRKKCKSSGYPSKLLLDSNYGNLWPSFPILWLLLDQWSEDDSEKFLLAKIWVQNIEQAVPLNSCPPFLPTFFHEKMFESIISSLHLSQGRKQCLMKRVTSHQKRKPMIADFLFNHRAWAKKWKESNVKCDCELLKNSEHV